MLCACILILAAKFTRSQKRARCRCAGVGGPDGPAALRAHQPRAAAAHRSRGDLPVHPQATVIRTSEGTKWRGGTICVFCPPRGGGQPPARTGRHVRRARPARARPDASLQQHASGAPRPNEAPCCAHARSLLQRLPPAASVCALACANRAALSSREHPGDRHGPRGTTRVSAHARARKFTRSQKRARYRCAGVGGPNGHVLPGLINHVLRRRIAKAHMDLVPKRLARDQLCSSPLTHPQHHAAEHSQHDAGAQGGSSPAGMRLPGLINHVLRRRITKVSKGLIPIRLPEDQPCSRSLPAAPAHTQNYAAAHSQRAETESALAAPMPNPSPPSLPLPNGAFLHLRYLCALGSSAGALGHNHGRVQGAMEDDANCAASASKRPKTDQALLTLLAHPQLATDLELAADLAGAGRSAGLGVQVAPVLALAAPQSRALPAQLSALSSAASSTQAPERCLNCNLPPDFNFAQAYLNAVAVARSQSANLKPEIHHGLQLQTMLPSDCPSGRLVHLADGLSIWQTRMLHPEDAAGRGGREEEAVTWRAMQAVEERLLRRLRAETAAMPSSPSPWSSSARSAASPEAPAARPPATNHTTSLPRPIPRRPWNTNPLKVFDAPRADGVGTELAVEEARHTDADKGKQEIVDAARVLSDLSRVLTSHHGGKMRP